jgi:hypothetical protein
MAAILWKFPTAVKEIRNDAVTKKLHRSGRVLKK